MLKVALLGCGRIGRMHASNIERHADAELASVFDVHGPSAATVAAETGASVANNVEEIFNDDAIDAVLVCTATDTHVGFIEQAVAAGKPILCEKPIDLSLERVNQCASNIAGTSVPVQLGFNRRFDPGHRAAHAAMMAGEIGDLHQVIITSRDPELPPREYLEGAGGLLRDMTIHDFDLARFMLNEEPTEVFAIAGALIDPKLGAELNEVDTTMIIMRTATGKQCHINGSRTAKYGYDQRIELLGSEGMLLSDNRKPHEMKRYTADVAEQASPYLYFFIERYAEAFNDQLTSFFNALNNGSQPEVGFDDGHKALILAEAAYKSIAEKRLVQVSEIA